MLYIFIPAARSRTTTLLRLHPGHKLHNKQNNKIKNKNNAYENNLFNIIIMISNETHSRHVTGGVYKI